MFVDDTPSPRLEFSPRLLRIARETRGLDREQFAHLVGRTVSAIVAYEGGWRTPPINQLALMAHILGLRVDDFLA